MRYAGTYLYLKHFKNGFDLEDIGVPITFYKFYFYELKKIIVN